MGFPTMNSWPNFAKPQGVGSAAFADLTGAPGDNTALAAALAAKSATGHGHAIGDVSGLQAAIDAKQATLTGTSDVPGLDTALGGKLPTTGGSLSGALTLTGYNLGINFNNSVASFINSPGGLVSQSWIGQYSNQLYRNTPTGNIHRWAVNHVVQGDWGVGGFRIGGSGDGARKLHVVDSTNPQLRLDDGTYTVDFDVQNGALHLSFDGGSSWYSVDMTAV